MLANMTASAFLVLSRLRFFFSIACHLPRQRATQELILLLSSPHRSGSVHYPLYESALAMLFEIFISSFGETGMYL
ncbi:hypothetical protein EV424DRAFT_1360773 [Suillus variegatus]|nr:hypothetical protein EV424DRAFT_1360773 [Suillus variegatus]